MLVQIEAEDGETDVLQESVQRHWVVQSKELPPGEFALRYDSRGERQVLSVPMLRRVELTYRCMKTIERAHSPKNLWEKVELPENKEQAISKIEENLQYWPEFLISRNKARFLRIKQYLKRMRKLRMKVK